MSEYIDKQMLIGAIADNCAAADVAEEYEFWDRVWRFIRSFPAEDLSKPKIDETEAIEILPHGRLIEADALKAKAYDSGLWANGHDGSHQMVVDIEDIDDAPTIIEAEKELDFSGMADENDSGLDFSGLDSVTEEGET